MSATSLYVHIPFCESLCSFCDFPKVLALKQWIKPYLQALYQEFLSKSHGPFKTIYIGGGTPSVLEEEYLKFLLGFLAPCLATGGEFSLEANPESLTPSKLNLMKKMGITRLSMGLQSSSDRILHLAGREGGFLEGQKALKMAKEAGFTSLNCDMIYGWDHETLEECQADIKAFLSLKVPHLSAYCLSIHPGCRLYNEGYKEMGQDEAADMYEAILKAFREAGYRRYEVSNFALEGYECQHNLTYWKDEEYVALGLGAAGYEGSYRYINTKNLSSYLAGRYLDSKEKVTLKDDLEYYFMTYLRLDTGFSLDNFAARFGFSFPTRYAIPLAKLEQEGLLKNDGKRIFTSDKGMLLLDKVLLELFN